MAELMGDPRDPDATDGAPTAADDAFALVLETAPVDTSVAVGGDAAAAREAARARGARVQSHTALRSRIAGGARPRSIGSRLVQSH